jgi:(E)-4-hydroxy-3-methylbut-2-enyl-diphosphate synthase
MFSENPIQRRKSRRITVGSVAVGGDAPVSVQSMTNTETTDVAATVAQIVALENAGADIVRVSIPTLEAAEAFGRIKQQVSVPLVTDIHFDYKIALRVAELGADCLRINPGNIGREDRVRAVVDAARDRGIPIRIGVNAGSLEKDLQKKYANPRPTHWWNPRNVTSICSTSSTFRISRSASRPRTFSWPWLRIASLPH